MKRRVLLKIWMWVQRIFALGSFGFSLIAFICYLKTFEWVYLSLQIGAGISFITAWKAAEFDELRLNMSLSSRRKSKEKKSLPLMSEGGVNNGEPAV